MTFQDFNKNVINDITPLWVEANLKLWKSAFSAEKATYISGDWEDLTKAASENEEERYDIILTADTVYNTGKYEGFRWFRVLPEVVYVY